MKTGFAKVRFTSKTHGATAGLVFTAAEIAILSLYDISRCYPATECLKMDTLETSPILPTWEGAFNYDFEATR